MKIIGLEEHFVPQSFLDVWLDLPNAERDGLTTFAQGEVGEKLADLGDGRIADMDAHGVDVQVLSVNSPGVQNLTPDVAVELAREANDMAAAAVREHPDRFQFFATVPTPDPGAAATELRRAVTELGAPGALINGRTGERNADHRDFDELYATAAELGAPIYLHPQLPQEGVRQAYYDGLGDPLDLLLAQFGLGWHFETGVQVVRMILSGTFDRHPELQVVVGHWGELVLFYLERLQSLESMGGVKLDRPLADYFTQNVSYTPSGMVSERYLRWTMEVAGVDRIMYSADYPFVPLGPGVPRKFLEDAPISATDKESIGHGNWERLTSR